MTPIIHKFFFVGERRSPTAIKKNWTWKSGRLAGYTLFEALKACNIDPATCNFENWFNGNQRRIKRASKTHTIVALGKKVSAALVQAEIEHIQLIHPAARGKIRNKKLYQEHVQQVLIANGLGVRE